MFFPPKQSQHLKTKSFVHLGNFLDLKQIFNKCFQMSVFFSVIQATCTVWHY